MADTSTSAAGDGGMDVQPAECTICVHTFSDTLQEKSVHFQVLKLSESIMLWIGTEPAHLTNLAMAMDTRFEKYPSGTNLMGDTTDLTSVSFAQKLARKTGKQVFVSYNLSPDQTLLSLVEKRVIKEIGDHPDMF